MDNEGLLQLIKNIVQKAVTESQNITAHPNSPTGLLQLLKLYQESLNGVWEELKLWQTKNQKGVNLEQMFALINNEYPIGLRSFYARMIEEGWTKEESLMFTRDLLKHFIGPRAQ